MRDVKLTAVGLVVAAMTWGVASCSGNSSSSGSCGGSTCDAGEICSGNVCRRVCQTDPQCQDATLICQNDVCVPGARADAPVITSIDGTGAVNNNAGEASHQVQRRITISGVNLEGSTVTLSDATHSWTPEICSGNDATLVVALPEEIVEGTYTLQVANQAGACESTVPVLRGEQGIQGIQGVPGVPCTGCVDAATLNSSVYGGNGAATTVARSDHTHPPVLNSPAAAPTSCQAILDAGLSRGDGVYWIDPTGGSAADAFRVRCDMTTLGGGWTLVTNVEPADGNCVSFTNTRFWRDEAEWGQFENHLTHDYKSPAAWLISGTNIMVQVANPGADGNVIGWKAWSMPSKSFDVFFDAANNTVQTTAVLSQSVDAVYAYEAIIKNGTQLRSNLIINPNSDRVRLGVDAYTQQGDDNQPGLGTQMNESTCGVGNDCYRYKDVELWVDSAANLWTTRPQAGSYKWIGTDCGCGASCGTADNNAGPGYGPYWTYRIYIR
ncbi:MAG: fibrinogen-like YCDxxxxGGGW domain-containing protein [Myxococcota bacterium]